VSLLDSCYSYAASCVPACFKQCGDWRGLDQDNNNDDPEDPTNRSSYVPDSAASVSWFSGWSGCFSHAATKIKNFCEGSGTIIYRGLLLSANIVSLPFAVFLWKNIRSAYADIYTDLIKEHWPAPKQLAWLVDIVLGIRIACSALLDITCSDLINLSFKGNSVKKAGQCHPLSLLYRFLQLMFLMTAATYASSYVTGMMYLAGGSVNVEIFETVVIGGLGTLYYFLFTNSDLEEHAFNITAIWPSIRRCFKDQDNHYKLDGIHIARLVVCTTLVLATALYRPILGGNDWLAFRDTISYLSRLSDSTIMQIYVATLINIFISTLGSRSLPIIKRYLPRRLTPEEKLLKAKIPYNLKDIKHTLTPAVMSAGLSYLLWSSNPIAAGLSGSGLFLLQTLINIDTERTHAAIIKNTDTPTETSTLLAKSSAFDEAVTELNQRGSKLHLLGLIMVCLGRSTRFDALINFIKANDNALREFNIVNLSFNIQQRLALAAIIGGPNIINDLELYGNKVKKLISSRQLRDAMRYTANPGSNKWYARVVSIFTDWKTNGEFSQGEINSTIPMLSALSPA
jgi:hypothetical protein